MGKRVFSLALLLSKGWKVKLVVASDEEDQELTEYRVKSLARLPDNKRIGGLARQTRSG